ncbi:MAG: MFS transporter [Tepidisphaerales bacterium]
MTQLSPPSQDASRSGDISPAPPPSAPPYHVNPWLFVPVLYFMQFLPNGVVTSLFGPVYKSLGVDNLAIATWTSLAALPWALKMTWGPLVDLNSTKRRWTLAMEFCIAATLILTTIALLTPYWWALTLAALFFIATFSATHDIACDGLYLMSLNKKQQAAFSGVMAASSRLGRLFLDSVIIYLGGYLVAAFAFGQQAAWSVALGICAGLYALGTLWNLYFLPRPPTDVPAVPTHPSERTHNLYRTAAVLVTGVVLYYFCNGLVQLAGHALFISFPGYIPDRFDQTGEVWNETFKVLTGVVLLPPLWLLIRWQVAGTPMGDAFATFFRQRGFWAILAFIIFYRFGDAMIFVMASLFFLDPVEKGGIGISLQQLGIIKGFGMAGGLIVGGLAGGWFIAKVGLRRAFWPLIVCLHTPNLLYVWASAKNEWFAAQTLSVAGFDFQAWPLFPLVFIEAAGYGAGFAGYFVFLMQVAQRNRFVTSHYAIATGLGALFITFAGIFAGIVYALFGYLGVFIAACVMTIPGTLTLLFIPLDDPPKVAPPLAAD